MKVELEPIGRVESPRKDAEDDYWGGEESCIVLYDRFGPDALQGLEDFSHAEVLFHFDRVDSSRIVVGARHPRNNREWPAVGIFAQRGKNRPNRIGSTICRLLRRDGLRLHVAELDAIDGTPVLDIKPVMREFLPRSEVRQPDWTRELMSAYWKRGSDGWVGSAGGKRGSEAWVGSAGGKRGSEARVGVTGPGNETAGRAAPRSTVSVRPSTPEDAPLVARLSSEFCEYLRSLGDPEPDEFSEETYLEDGFGPTPAFSGLVAEIEGESVGYLLYCPSYDLDLGGRITWVIDLFVTGSARRNGAARALMNAVARICRDSGGSHLFWSVFRPNTLARDFYERLGAQYTREAEFMHWRVSET